MTKPAVLSRGHVVIAIAGGWALALRTAQIREEARTLAEQLAEANRNLQTAQTEILRSRTLSTVGEMAAGAAHEMNNPLMVISGRAQLLAQQLADPKLSDVTPSENSQFVLGVDDREYRPLRDYDEGYSDTYLVDGATGNRALLAKKIHGTMTWIPGYGYTFVHDKATEPPTEPATPPAA